MTELWCPETKIFSLLQRHLARSQPNSTYVTWSHRSVCFAFAFDSDFDCDCDFDSNSNCDFNLNSLQVRLEPAIWFALGLTRWARERCNVAKIKPSSASAPWPGLAWLIWLWQIFGPVQWATSNPNSCDKSILNAIVAKTRRVYEHNCLCTISWAERRASFVASN